MKSSVEPVSGGPAGDAGDRTVVGTWGLVAAGLGEQGTEQLHLVGTWDPPATTPGARTEEELADLGLPF